MPRKSQLMLWSDLETTGLNNTDHILEIGLYLTKPDLTPIEYLHIVLNTTPGIINTMDPYVHNMHTKNGLINEALDSTTTLSQAQNTIWNWLNNHIPPREVPLCGSTVHFDRRMLAHWMPTIENHFSYRNIDVSSIKELAIRWNPAIYDSCPPPQKKHRTMPDIEDSIQELTHYRRTWLTQSQTK